LFVFLGSFVKLAIFGKGASWSFPWLIDRFRIRRIIPFRYIMAFINNCRTIILKPVLIWGIFPN